MQNAAIIALLLLAASLPGCEEKSDCEEACLRVSRCRLQARQGDPMLGERDLPPDERCMKRCKDEREQFDKCEGLMRNCEALRGCYGLLR